MLTFFRELDREEYWGDFTQELWGIVQAMAPSLQAISGWDFRITNTPQDCQDGSMMGEIGVPMQIVEAVQMKNWRFVPLAFEFSSFGKLFRWRSAITWTIIKPEVIDSMTEHIRTQGFVFVSASDCELPYDGSFNFKGMTWGERFFEMAF